MHNSQAIYLDWRLNEESVIIQEDGRHGSCQYDSWCEKLNSQKMQKHLPNRVGFHCAISQLFFMRLISRYESYCPCLFEKDSAWQPWCRISRASMLEDEINRTNKVSEKKHIWWSHVQSIQPGSKERRKRFFRDRCTKIETSMQCAELNLDSRTRRQPNVAKYRFFDFKFV